MKLAIAQIPAIKGNIEENKKKHLHWIHEAHGFDADAIFFPELSLTGYEPTLANELATTMFDSRLEIFQELSNLYKMAIGIGMPTKSDTGLHISMIIFQANKDRNTYSKQYLYPTEFDYFSAGNKYAFLNFGENKIVSIAICYELSEPEHSHSAVSAKTNLYVASVCNTVAGVEKDLGILSDIAKKNKIHTFMSNFVGTTGGYACAGKSSIWDRNGKVIHQMDGFSQGIMVFDTKTDELEVKLEN